MQLKDEKTTHWRLTLSPATSIFNMLSSNCIFTHGHGASKASGVRNFWHSSAKILYTVEPKKDSPCVHFEVGASPTEKKTSLLHVSVLSHFEIVEIIGTNTREII